MHERTFALHKIVALCSCLLLLAVQHALQPDSLS